MLVLIFGGVFPIFYVFPYQLSKIIQLNRTIRLLGIFSVGVAALLPISSLFKMPLPHDIIVVIATIPALIAAFLLFLTTFMETSSRRWVKVIGFLMMTIAMVNMILYLRVQWFGSPLTALLPGTQKVVLLLCLVWMFSLTTTLESLNPGPLGPFSPTTLEKNHKN